MLRKLKIAMFRKLTLRGYQWFFTIRAVNGEPIAQSEGFSRRIDCEATARLFIDRDFEIVELAE